MSGLGRWLPDPLDAGPFRFRGGGPPPRHRIVRRAVKPGPDGPVYNGDVWTRNPGGTFDRHHNPALAGQPYPVATTPEDR